MVADTDTFLDDNEFEEGEDCKKSHGNDDKYFDDLILKVVFEGEKKLVDLQTIHRCNLNLYESL